MSFQIHKRDRRSIEVEPALTRFDENTIVASASWLDTDGRRRERYQVLTLRDDKIVDIQGCATRQQAERFARHKRA